MLLIDGTNLLIRIQSACIKKDNHKAIFIRALLKMAHKFNDFEVYVAWDVTPSKYRLEIYPEYKKYKTWGADFVLNLRQQLMNDLHGKILPIAGVVSIMVANVEADDIIAELCRRFKNDKVEKTIISTDQDYYQLIDEYTSVYDGDYNRFTDMAALLEKHEVTDLAMAVKLELIKKCLVGDASDNITGVKGVGVVKMQRILNGYKCGAFLPEDIQLLRENKELIEKWRSLVVMDLLPDNYKATITDRIDKAIKLTHKFANNDDYFDSVVEEFNLKEVRDGMRKLQSWCGD